MAADRTIPPDRDTAADHAVRADAAARADFRAWTNDCAGSKPDILVQLRFGMDDLLLIPVSQPMLRIKERCRRREGMLYRMTDDERGFGGVQRKLLSIANEAPSCSRRLDRAVAFRGAKRQMLRTRAAQSRKIGDDMRGVCIIGQRCRSARTDLREREWPAVIVETRIGHQSSSRAPLARARPV